MRSGPACFRKIARLAASCEKIGREDALGRADNANVLRIDHERCVAWGECIGVCADEALIADVRGYRILVGGKLGRHPQLGRELPGLFDREQVLAVVEASVNYYKRWGQKGERFGEILNRHGLPDHPLFSTEKSEPFDLGQCFP